jgi:hypothetical protein
VKALEFTDREIRSLHSLHSFISINSYADIGLLDHIAVIGPIADRQCDFADLRSNQPDHFCLLFGGCAATDHRLHVLHYEKETVD